MNKRSLISLILTCAMLAGTLISCGSGESLTDDTKSETLESVTESVTDKEPESDSETVSDSEIVAETESEKESEKESESDTEKATETETEVYTEEDTTPLLDCDNGPLIELANRLANDVKVYYSDADRTSVILENSNMSLEYELRGEKDQLVSSLKNAAGKSYIDGSMDVFVKMQSGNTYFSSTTSTPTYVNIYRLGYYYYDVRLENQDFSPTPDPISEKEIPLRFSSNKHLTKPKIRDGEATVRISGGNDPYLVFSEVSHDAEKYGFLQLTLKVDSKKSERIELYYKNEDNSSFSDQQKLVVPIITDGEFHTYNICLATAPSYSGKINGIRIDFMGEEGTEYVLKTPKLLEVQNTDVPELMLGRFFQLYSDKLHHYAQFCASDTVEGIAEVGMLTSISADRVEKIVIKDKNGLHDSLSGVDFNSAEYVGFDIKDAGIFGYIIPTGRYGGRLEVTLSDGVYSIIQTLTPDNNQIIPSKKGTNNANDFYMGQRIYTDMTHDFTKFLKEAEAERHPLTSENIKVDKNASTNASFAGYDPLRGKYVFNVGGSDFSTAYYKSPNKQYTVSFSVVGDSMDRKMYFSSYTTSGGLECAVLLDDRQMLLPIPLEVCKNFVGDGESNIYNLDEPSYGEAYFPMVLKAGEEKSYTIVNLYQNWGKYPLKQLSSIQYFYPYYHLSTGVTESNCIIPFADIGPGLPDHRAMSAPLWKDQPQHTLGGAHYFIQYTDANGSFAASQNMNNLISSHGPTYAEVDMSYLTDDGRIKVTYTHMEMPQTDENRTYYVMNYEVLEDISFTDFGKDFSFYSVRQTGTGSTYRKVGYLDKDNNPQIVDAMKDGDEASYVLGDKFPYFDFFYVPDYTNANGYVNLSFLISHSKLIIGGKETEASFLLTNKEEKLYLSLDLKEVTLKKGDLITIEAILMPWGSQESIYDGSNGKAPDENVRAVRENSIIDPFKATAVSDCAVMESVFIPKVRSTNGKSATFTLSGGENNVVTRVYGFDMLTVPVIEEKIGNEWVVCDISSSTPDSLANTNAYDGYMAHYDGDGSFSYSFVTTLTGDSKRTFRISADKAFEGWPEKEETEENEENTPINVYLTPSKLKTKLDGAKGVGGLQMLEEDGVEFIRIFGNGKDDEGHSTFYKTEKVKESGQYAVIKYRIPKENPEDPGCFEIFTSTVNSSATAGDQIYCYNLKNDGYWHVIVVDLTKEKHPTFSADNDGKFYANYLRFDFFSGKRASTSYVDIAYVGMSASFEDILKLNSDMNTVTVVTGGSTRTYFDVHTGEMVAESGDCKPRVGQYIDLASGYSEATVKYAAFIDMINGWGIGDEQRLQNVNASSLKAPDELDYGPTTVNGHQLIFTGWAVVDGGVDRYVWSVDGGKTWQDAIPVSGKINSAVDAQLNSASTRLEGYTFSDITATSKNASFQGTIGAGAKVNGIYADLAKYAGKTVDITFAAVPASATDTLCIIVHLKGVKVAE